MRNAGSWLTWPATASFLVLGASLLEAERPSAPPFFAIKGARVVPVSGPAIDGATVVMAHGLITAVGKDAPIPPEAWVVEGAGLTVYPGLIDALTNLGLAAGETATALPTPGTPSPPPRAPSQPQAQGPEDRPSTTPWENAADRVSLEDGRLASWRKAGFTAAVTAPDRGIFTGQAALIHLAGETTRHLVLKTPVALRMNLDAPGGFRGFPGSLMGVIAYARQTYLDAEHDAKAWSTYESNPRGLARPSYDRALGPIRAAVTAGRPVLYPAHWAKEIHRAMALGDEVGARFVIYGGHQAHQVASTLAARKAAVLMSLKWPEKEKDVDPDADESLRVLRFRDLAPSAPAALEKAGVRFAFYSDGIAAPQELLKNVRLAIDAGLSKEAALRAFTLSAAEIYGVADRLGSVEPGKVADLVVTDGDLFEEKTKVKMVFVDGRKYESREPGRPTEPPALNLTGIWKLSVTTQQGNQESTAELNMAEDGTLSGTVTGPRGTASLTGGWVSGTQFHFTLSLSMGPRTVEASYTGTVEGERLTGAARFGRVSSDFTGTRSSAPPQRIEGEHE
jgi:imidazolonepropionase-like amidohydrolase